MTDYRTLLMRYMQFVGETTGTDYTGNTLNKSSLLTDEEKAALRVLSDIVWAIK